MLGVAEYLYALLADLLSSNTIVSSWLELHMLMLNGPSARSSWKSLDQTWSSHSGSISTRKLCPPGPLVAAGRSLREGGNGNGAGSRSLIFFPAYPPFFPLPSLPPGRGWRKSQGGWALMLGRLGPPLRPDSRAMEPGPGDTRSPAIYHHIFVVVHFGGDFCPQLYASVS